MTYSTIVERPGARARLALLSLSSALSVGIAQPAAADYTPPKVYALTPGGVSVSDGSFMFSATDLAIGPLTLTRNHIGGLRDPNTTPFGPHMTHNFDIFLARNVRTDCSGGPSTCVTYGKPVVHLGTTSSGTFHEVIADHTMIHNDLDSYQGELKYNTSAAKYEYTDADGNIYTFDPAIAAAGAANSARVSKIALANGNVQTFLYDGSNRLKVVQDDRGYALVFDYNSYGLISATCGYDRASTYVSSSTTCAAASLKAQYTYSSSGSHPLLTVTDAGGRQETYSYSGTEITCIKPIGYATCKISNTYSASVGWQVASQTLGDGSTWQFQYIGDPTKPRDPDKFVDTEPSFTTIVTDPHGKTSGYSFVESSPYSFSDQLGNTTNYQYTGGTQFGGKDESTDHGTELLSVTYPEGNQWVAEYNAPRNAMTKRTLKTKPGAVGGGIPDATINLGYVASCDPSFTPGANPKWCGKPIYIQDELGHQTDYTYTAFGALETELQPAPSSGAARPLKLYTYAQKYAYVKNTSGTLVQTGTSIWLPSTETQCQTAAGSSTPTCDVAAQQMVTTYEYGANGTADNLLLRGKVVSADGQSLRTCYRYDALSNKIAETSPRAGLASCPAS